MNTAPPAVTMVTRARSLASTRGVGSQLHSLVREQLLQLNTHPEDHRVEDQSITDLSTELPKSQGLERNGRRERFSAVRLHGQVPSFNAKGLRHSAICEAL